MDDRSKVVVTSLRIALLVWLVALFALVFVLLRDLGIERGAPLTYRELVDAAFDFKYFAAVLMIGVVGFFWILRVPSTASSDKALKRQ